MKKQLLFMFAALCSITAMAQVPTYVPTTNLVAWYSFTGNTNDLSGNGNNLTNNGAVTYTQDRFGNNSACASFNGTNQYFNRNATNFFTGNSDRSISLWYNVNANPFDSYSNPLFDYWSGSCYQCSSIFLDHNANNTQYSGYYFWGRCDDADWQNSTTIPALNTWYHIVIVYAQGTIFLYQNGVLQTYSPTLISLNTGSSNFSIGYGINSATGTYNYFKGLIDDIGVWNRALSSCEVQQLFTSSLINSPTASITPQGATTFCTGGFVNLNANIGTGYTYQWYNNNVLISGETNSTYTASQGGSYTVVVNNSGCTATSTAVAVTVNAAPSGAVNVSGATTFCSGNNVTLTAQGTGTYLWSNNATSNSITVNQSGNYSVTVTANGCSATSGITAVTVNQTPIASITPVGSTTFCQGGFVTLNASGGGTYQWNTSATSASINANQSNTYSVIVTSNGCSATASQVVTVNPLPNVTLGALGNLTNINAAPVTLSGSPSGGTYTGAGVSGSTFNPHTAGLGTHYIHYNYTTGAGCSGNATQSTIVYDTTGLVCTTYDTVLTSVTDTLIIHAVLTGVNPPNNTNTIKVYPNPASDHIYINNGNYASMTGYSCTITNALSQQVFYSLINQQQFYIDLSTWTGHGIYFKILV